MRVRVCVCVCVCVWRGVIDSLDDDCFFKTHDTELSGYFYSHLEPSYATMMNGVVGQDSALLDLYWAEDYMA